jgi:hypothetical protein
MQFGWRPGIGDPTIGGWMTVVLYFVAAFSCWRTARSIRRDPAPQSESAAIWLALAVLFVALGFNKQLDLQSGFTEIGRMVAIKYGWYDRRADVQFEFIVAMSAVFVITLVAIAIWIRKAPAPTLLSFCGVVFVLAFVLIRAASFHHVDRFIGMRVLGLRWNWILEMAGIGLVLAGSWWRHAQLTGRTRA